MVRQLIETKTLVRSCTANLITNRAAAVYPYDVYAYVSYRTYVFL